MGNHNNQASASISGNKDKNTQSRNSLIKSKDKISIKLFNKLNVVGKGGFGKVYLL